MRIILLQFTKNYFIFLLLFLLCQAKALSQTKTYATVVTEEYETDNSNLAIDGDLSTKADINASSGLLLGLGSYYGYLELQFPSVIPWNTTSYVKIDLDDDLYFSFLKNVNSKKGREKFLNYFKS